MPGVCLAQLELVVFPVEDESELRSVVGENNLRRSSRQGGGVKRLAGFQVPGGQLVVLLDGHQLFPILGEAEFLHSIGAEQGKIPGRLGKGPQADRPGLGLECQLISLRGEDSAAAPAGEDLKV